MKLSIWAEYDARFLLHEVKCCEESPLGARFIAFEPFIYIDGLPPGLWRNAWWASASKTPNNTVELRLAAIADCLRALQ
jgi:hypothetical protein